MNQEAQNVTKNALGSGVVKVKSGGSPDRFWNPRFWDGMTVSAWFRLLRSGRWQISPARYPMWFVISCLAPFNSFQAKLQQHFYGRRIAVTRPVQDPVFIIGHWRSGTTLLHEYVMLDERFATINTYECFAPTHFLITENYIVPWLKYLLPKKRPMDNMKVGLDRPQEDEFAIAALGMNSPYRSVAFPNNDPIDADYLTLRRLSDEDRNRWLDTFETLVKALTVKYNKTLVLKSPPHTARVGAILERFPNAKFVHISRDPFVLFPSTVNLWTKLSRVHGLQIPKGGQKLEERVLSYFEDMYDSFFEAAPSIRKGNLCEISYDELVANPLATLERIYTELDLGDFEKNRESFQKFADSQKGYQKNKFDISDEMKEIISKRWKKYFDRYVND